MRPRRLACRPRPRTNNSGCSDPTMDVLLHTATADETRAVGEALAPLLGARDAVILTGELGAGKTTFVQGVARGLGVHDRVTSPTFMLVREYTGRLDIAHVDVYRLDRLQEVVDLAIDEIGAGNDVLLVEWGDAVEDLLPEERLRVELTTDDVSDARRILVTASGASWRDRREQLARALAPWRVEA
jgi:tRNA threonylcarbamoyladenosine biosynthesis protein TsaE